MRWEYLESILETESIESQQSVVSTLFSLGCCERCVLRFIGETQQRIYRYSVQELHDGFEEFLNRDSTLADKITVSNSLICIACLGILQEKYCCESFLNELGRVTHDSGFQYKTFFCSLTIPVSIIIREYGVWLKLQDVVSSVYTHGARDQVPRVKEVWKWCNGADLGKIINAPFDQKSPFEVVLNFEHSDSYKDCRFLFDALPDKFLKRKPKKGWETFTRANVTKALDNISSDKFRRLANSPSTPVTEPASCKSISCAHEAVFVAGRYNKFSRNLSQTPWVLDGVRKTESSVEEYICCPIKNAFKADEYKFSSSGREDLDVKMLGRGRPFIVELINPHQSDISQDILTQVQQTINKATDDVQVRDLQVVSREDTNRLKEGEAEKTKHYSALCWSSDVLSDVNLDKLHTIKDLVVTQHTPLRVLHRRPLAARERVIHSMSARALDDHHFILTLSTQAGTYIKEFVHSDFGRTNPNLCDILETECDIRELNVEAVDLDWPPTISE